MTVSSEVGSVPATSMKFSNFEILVNIWTLIGCACKSVETL